MDLIASKATLALNTGLWVRRLLIGGSPFSGGRPDLWLTMGPAQITQITSAAVHRMHLIANACAKNKNVFYEA